MSRWTKSGYECKKACILLCVPCLRELRILGGIHDMRRGDIKVIRPAKRLNRGVLSIHVSNISCNHNLPSTYMTRSPQRGMKLTTHLPHPIRIQLQQHAEQLRFLRTNPSIPMADIRLVIDISGIATILPSLVLFLDRSNVPIAVDIVREDQMPRSRVVSKVGCRLGGDRADVQALSSNFQGLVGCGCCTV